ncbi:MAG TPA: hypothetical protein VKY19_14040 [Ktedonosporobacter sp.]|nr:hypothetical protein [Ktedonosporobacter sp.]
MNCIATDLELKQYGVQTDLPVKGDSYMTQPMPVMTLPCELVDEEEVYSSFEEALSERQRALQWKLRLLSNASLQAVRDTDPLAQQSVTSARTNVSIGTSASNRGWQRGLIFASLALILVLTGFDFMGLLVLHMH